MVEFATCIKAKKNVLVTILILQDPNARNGRSNASQTLAKMVENVELSTIKLNAIAVKKLIRVTNVKM